MAKQKSKRVSERKKTRTVVRKSRQEAKARRELRKKSKKAVKVPKSVLMTEEEKEHLQSIREATEKRNRETQAPKITEPEYMTRLKECECDTFIEVVDFRDIESSRNPESEAFLAGNGKNLYFFVNFVDEAFSSDLSFLNTKNTAILNDLQVLSASNKICILGNPKTGKFLLSKHIEQINPTAKFEIIRTPMTNLGLVDVLRGSLSVDDINPPIMFNKCWKFIDVKDIREFYMLGRFDSSETFLDLLAEKLSKDQPTRKSHSEAARHFFRDVQSGRIRWIRHSDRIQFKFIRD